MALEDRLTIETPEGVDLQITLAGLGSRVGANLLDSLILGLIVVVVIIAIAIVGFGPISEDVLFLIFGLGFLLLFLVYFGYYLLFETLNSGRTPGKAAMGIRVIRLDGTPLRFGAVAIRNVLRFVDSLPIFYATGLISIVVTARNQRIGDLVAGTVVIRDRKSDSVKGLLGEPEQLSHLPRWDTTAVSEDEVALIRRFMERRSSLTVSKREELAASIAERLRAKVLAPDEPEEAEAFLARVLAEKLHRGIGTAQPG